MIDFRKLEHKQINLKSIYKLDYDLILDAYILGDYNWINNEKHEGLLIIPGGGYQEVCSNREGEPLAISFLAQGFNCFVLEYRPKMPYPNPHIDVCYALHFINTHTKEFNIFDHGANIIGFSAGGHLAASFSYLYKDVAKLTNICETIVKPHAVILGYPVITDEFEDDSFRTIGVISSNDKRIKDLFICYKHVTADFPPTYIWSTYADELISYKNTESFVKSLEKNNVIHQSHIFETGEHGGASCTRACYPKDYVKIHEILPNRIWVNEAADFIYNLDK